VDSTVELARREFLRKLSYAGLGILLGCGGGTNSGHESTSTGWEQKATPAQRALVINGGSVTNDDVGLLIDLLGTSEKNLKAYVSYNGPHAEENFYNNLDWVQVGHSKRLAAHPNVYLDDGAGYNSLPFLCNNIGQTLLSYISAPMKSMASGESSDMLAFELDDLENFRLPGSSCSKEKAYMHLVNSRITPDCLGWVETTVFRDRGEITAARIASFPNGGSELKEEVFVFGPTADFIYPGAGKWYNVYNDPGKIYRLYVWPDPAEIVSISACK
jgi:hypothetical protein